MAARAGAIVRVDAQLVEDGLIAEFALPPGLPPGGAHHAGQQLAYPLRRFHADLTAQQQALPAG